MIVLFILQVQADERLDICKYFILEGIKERGLGGGILKGRVTLGVKDKGSFTGHTPVNHMSGSKANENHMESIWKAPIMI